MKERFNLSWRNGRTERARRGGLVEGRRTK